MPPWVNESKTIQALKGRQNHGVQATQACVVPSRSHRRCRDRGGEPGATGDATGNDSLPPDGCMKKPRIGSNFDDFLQQDGLLADCEAVALRRVVTWQIEQEMKRRRISRAKLASA